MAQQTALSREMMFEEFVRRYTGKRYEYIDGRAVPMGPEVTGPEGKVEVAPTKFEHGKISGWIHSLLGAYVIEHNLGEVLSAETGFLMRKDPPEMRAADVAFIPHERAATIEDEAEWLDGPPDLAVEVVSEHDRAADIRDRAEGYIENGTRLLWIVYPKNRVIDVYQAGQAEQTVTIEDSLEGGEVVPGFGVPLRTIFAE